MDHRALGPQGFFHRAGIFLAIVLFAWLAATSLSGAAMVAGIAYVFFLGLGWVFRL